eukprot:TRINITY_DN6687_c0_g1_i2.p1 TRINITY_DN6687_c0_g1~~TRINITY_DN6687_c0_g1_i2.p1  ORF type:complete len:454 (+),score=78.40 TRINITY_DN6687_c0_g1_i2:353-1714(+)
MGEQFIVHSISQITSPSDQLTNHDEEIIYKVDNWCIFRLWIRICAKALASCVPVLLFLWIYSLPALIMRQHASDGTKELLYVTIRKVLSAILYYGLIASYGVALFGIQLCWKGLLFCWWPSLFFVIMTNIFMDIPTLINIVNLVMTVVLILIVYHQPLPKDSTPSMIESYERKCSISKTLAKMAIVVGFAFILLQVLLSIFLSSSFFGQIVLRFAILPSLISSCMALQMYFLKSIPPKHVEYAVPTLWISNGFLKMAERLFTNSMFNSGDYIYFVLSTFAAAIIEIISHATYLKRVSILHNLISRMRFSFEKKRNSIHNLSVIEAGEREMSSMPTAQPRYNLVSSLRKQMVIEDISIEIIMVFTVTFLLYFMHPLNDRGKFETIPSLHICIVQLLIQLVFELISDFFGLYWTMNHHHITLQASDILIENHWSWVWIFFIMFQSLYVLYFLVSY